MLSKYLKLSFRLMARNPFFTFINVAGLSVGLAVFLVLWQYSQNELKSDQFHKDFERISRLCYFWNFADSNGNPDHSVNSGIDPEVARLIDVDFDEIEDHTRILNQPNMWDGYLKIHGNKLFLVNEGSYDNVSFMESKVVYGDSNLFSFFSLPLVKGDASSVLSEANSIVLSEASAQKYFGDVDPLGKLLLLNGTIPLHVAGVFKDLPANTHLQFEIVISIKTIHRVVSEIAFGRFYCYFKIRKGIDQSSLQKKVNETANALYLPLLERAGFKELPKVELFFQPLKDVAFPKPEYGGIWGDNNWAKSKTLLKTFETVAIVILLMAWINYTNLTIASNRKRVKELGARRAVGAGLPDFMKQFLIDALVMNIMAIGLAATLVQMIKTPLTVLFNFYVPEWNQINPSTVFVILLVMTLGVLLTGVYPALATIKRSPRELFGSLTKKIDSSLAPHLLTSFQLVAAVTLIVWAFAFSDQVGHVMRTDLGFRRNNILLVDMPTMLSENWKTQLETLEKEIERLPGVLYVSHSRSMPGDNAALLNLVQHDNNIATESNGGVDENFIPLFNIHLLAGRNFLKDGLADQTSILVSRKTAQQLGFAKPEDAIGSKTFIQKSPTERLSVEIVGVFEDYVSNPLFNSFKAYRGNILTYGDFLFDWMYPPTGISILTEPDFDDGSLKRIEETFRQAFPKNVFAWRLFNDHINEAYGSEKTARNQVLFFTSIAIGIACLGLLGMIANRVEEKTKEIGIRKVMGAHLHHVAQLLVRSSVLQLLIAVVAGIPIAYYLTQQYLNKFASRIDLKWWHGVIPILILTFIMIAVIASHLWKAMRANPVEALKHE